MADSELLSEKRAALAEARRVQAIAREKDERFERGRPWVDGVQVGFLDLAYLQSREFPADFFPTTATRQGLYDAVQDLLAFAGVDLFLINVAQQLQDAPALAGPGRSDALNRVLALSRQDSYRHVADGFRRFVTTEFANLAPRIIEVFMMNGLSPGDGHTAAVVQLGNDPVWERLAELDRQPDAQITAAAAGFSEGIMTGLDSAGRLGARDGRPWVVFARALCEYRDGPGRWAQIEEAADALTRLWIEVAGLDESADGDAAWLDYSDNLLIADGGLIPALPGYSIGGLEAQIQLIEDNGGALPMRPSRSEFITQRKTGSKRKREIAVPNDLLAGPSPLLIRTDFSSDVLWREILEAALAERTFINGDTATVRADLMPVDDERFDALTMQELLDLPWPEGETAEGAGYFFVVDDETIEDPERPILAVSLGDRGESFRLTPEAMALTEANLSIGNLSFSDYLDSAQDGIVREA